MSHISKIEINILDLESLEKAVKNLGGKLIKNQKEYKWFGRWVGGSPMPEGLTENDLGKCNHAISFPNAEYEVGVVKNKNKPGYTLQYDFWYSGGLDIILGQNACNLKKQYTREITKKAAKLKGYKVDEKEEDNKIRMRIYVS